MFLGLVHDGTIPSLDEPVAKYVAWWPQTGAKSRVTLAHLLSFTSGFGT
jgi:CubicO group peptidase (beta-lactamase class C family)